MFRTFVSDIHCRDEEESLMDCIVNQIFLQTLLGYLASHPLSNRVNASNKTNISNKTICS